MKILNQSLTSKVLLLLFAYAALLSIGANADEFNEALSTVTNASNTGKGVLGEAMRWVFAVFLPSLIFAHCFYVPCNAEVQSGKQQTKASLEKNFNSIKEELKLTKQNDENYLKTLQEGNKELDLKIALYKQKVLHLKETLFLLHKGIQLEDKNINLEAQP